jgi:hypothetical protein
VIIEPEATACAFREPLKTKADSDDS